MRILIACNDEGNAIISLERDALLQCKGVQEVESRLETFWDPAEKSFEVVHIHWPEALFSWREPDGSDLAKLRSKLAAWKKVARIVVTSHNRYPHYRGTTFFEKLYRLVYDHTDAVIHMGKASYEDFKQRYPEHTRLQHAIIPHGMYSNFPNTLSKNRARELLGIPLKDVVYLVFGSLRNSDELELILDAFGKAQVTNKKLLIVGRINLPRSRLKVLLMRLKMWVAKDIGCIEGYIPTDSVQEYFKASDAVVIPRIEVMNSGNVVLGFAFSRAVIGPDIGVVGEILQETENISYAAGKKSSLVEALEQAASMDLETMGERNLKYATLHWNWALIAEQHAKLFRRLVEKTDRDQNRTGYLFASSSRS